MFDAFNEQYVAACDVLSITGSGGNSPSVNQAAFPATPVTGQYFWSASSYVSLPTYAWGVTSSTGDSNPLFKARSRQVTAAWD
jgi:hypothetical protein